MTEADLNDAVANEPTPVGLVVETVVSTSETPPLSCHVGASFPLLVRT